MKTTTLTHPIFFGSPTKSTLRTLVLILLRLSLFTRFGMPFLATPTRVGNVLSKACQSSTCYSILFILVFIAPVLVQAQSLNTNVFLVSREESQRLYNTLLVPSFMVRPPRSTLATISSNCEPPAFPLYAQNAMLRTIEYFRGLAGLTNELALDSSYSDGCMQLATVLVTSTNGLRNLHSPDPVLSHCYTLKAGETGPNSLIAYSSLGESVTIGPYSIFELIVDPGDNNSVLGHRMALLRPSLTLVGIGSIDTTTNNPYRTSSPSCSVVQVAGPDSPTISTPDTIGRACPGGVLATLFFAKNRKLLILLPRC